MWIVCFSSASNCNGIKGAFWDHNGTIILHFEKEHLVDSPIEIEVLAIREDLIIANASQWVSLVLFHVEFDSLNTVSWFSKPFSIPWIFHNTIHESFPNFGCHIM